MSAVWDDNSLAQNDAGHATLTTDPAGYSRPAPAKNHPLHVLTDNCASNDVERVQSPHQAGKPQQQRTKNTVMTQREGPVSPQTQPGGTRPSPVYATVKREK